LREYYQDDGYYNVIDCDNNMEDIFNVVRDIINQSQPNARKPQREERIDILNDVNLKNITTPETSKSNIARIKGSLCRIFNVDLEKEKEKNNAYKLKFPGSISSSYLVSLAPQIHQFPYLFSIAPVGNRYLMYLSSDYQYLIDKDLKLYKINLKHELNITGETLLDGELTKYKEKRKGIVNPLLFVVNDAITINANTIIEENLYDRLEKLKIFIEEVGQAFYFDFQIQIYYKIYDIERAINQIIPTSLAYQPDGILFVPCNKPYKRGYSKAILKWKPPSLMTIDFLVKKKQKMMNYTYLFVQVKII